MDALVAQAMAKWPNVPAVYGWLSLDRRGNWRIKGERIANQALRDFISRNYELGDAIQALRDWELSYRKECFYYGLRVLLELARDGKSKL